MTSDKMNLVWSEHLSNLQEESNLLYEDKSMSDVSIFCQERCLRAHKLILTACSPYFKQVLQENPCKHATIIMHSINYQDMASLLEYVYKGHVAVSNDRLENLLKIAVELRIKGFEDHMNLIKNSNEMDECFKIHRRPTLQKEGCNFENNQIEDENNYNISHNSFTTSTPIIKSSNRSFSPNEMLDISENTMNGLGDHFLKKMYHGPVKIGIDSFESAFDCELCDSAFKSRKSLQDHKKEYHTTCEFCKRRFSSVRDLIRHRRLHTGERPFSCNFCDKSFTRKDYLSHHLKSCPSPPIITLNNKTVPKVENMKENYSDIKIEPPLKMENYSTLPFTNINISGKEKRTRGRPKKDSFINQIKKEKRTRGRPRKYPIIEKPKRGRGRPRKENYSQNPGTTDESDTLTMIDSPYENMGDLQIKSENLETLMAIEPIVEIKTDDVAMEDQSGKCDEDFNDSNEGNI